VNAADYYTYHCAFCGEENETLVDSSAGLRQSFTEDCAVCCRPNVVHIVIDQETAAVTIETERES